jgi:nucleoside-diphosphate-sugar epimerase
MAGEKILVLGGTGKAGICLLRELLFRNHATVVYCRNPSKLPTDLYPNPLLEVPLVPFSIPLKKMTSSFDS